MRWTQRVNSAAGLGLLLLGLAACPALPDGPRYRGHGNKAPVAGGTLMLYEEQRVRMLDPHIAFDVASGVVIEMVFDSLYRYDQKIQLTPNLAESLPTISDDGMTVVVKLKRGVRFHNGRELVARDVVWSFERMMSPALFSPGAPYYSAIDGAPEYQAKKADRIRGLSAPDPYTVVFRLSQPDQSFVHTLAMRFAAPLPKEEVLARGSRWKRDPVGTGPFRLVSWDRGVRLVLARNPLYHVAGLPHVDQVVIEEGLKRDTAFLRFRNAEVDIMPRLSPADHLMLKTPAWRDNVAVAAHVDIYGLFLNCELAPLDNLHIRRAIAFAIDRERWARARNFDIRAAGQILPPGIMGHDPRLPNLQRFDLAKAREEMRLAGHPDGLEEPITMWMSDSPTGRVYGELAQSDLAKIGIDLRLKPVSFPVYLEETGKPKTAQIAAGGWSMDFPDPSNFLSLVSSKTKAERDSSNRSFFSHPKLDALLDKAIVERDPVKRAAMYHEANDFVAGQAPWAFFANTQGSQAWQPYVKGYRPHPVQEMAVGDVWLDLPRKRVANLARQLNSHFAFLLPVGDP